MELVALDLYVAESELEPVWRRAVERGLIHPVGKAPDTGEQLYEADGR